MKTTPTTETSPYWKSVKSCHARPDGSAAIHHHDGHVEIFKSEAQKEKERKEKEEAKARQEAPSAPRGRGRAKTPGRQAAATKDLGLTPANRQPPTANRQPTPS